MKPENNDPFFNGCTREDAVEEAKYWHRRWTDAETGRWAWMVVAVTLGLLMVGQAVFFAGWEWSR